MNRSHDSGTVKTGSRIIIYENKFPLKINFSLIDSKMVQSDTTCIVCG